MRAKVLLPLVNLFQRLAQGVRGIPMPHINKSAAGLALAWWLVVMFNWLFISLLSLSNNT